MAVPRHHPTPLSTVARFAAEGDNVAIALSTLSAGTKIEHYGSWQLPHPVLEGHRFAVTLIRRGDELFSWGYPFGHALCDINPGDWIRNTGMVKALAQRDRKLLNLDTELPTNPNFSDLPLSQFARADQAGQESPLPRPSGSHHFEGYDRGDRGVGTRNYVIVLAVNSHAGASAKALARRMDIMARTQRGCDGVVPVAHTEGGGPEPPNNRDLLLRTLIGFLVHPNVAGAVVLDHPAGAVRWTDVSNCAEARLRKLERVPIVTAIAGDTIEEAAVLPLFRAATSAKRREVPESALNIALQCGGSDAFSGISGNPLAAAVAREVIAGGGAAILSETDELIGAERYVLSSVADRPTAAAFLQRVERFKAWTDRHGQSAAANPSGGNMLRGLYNITLKSIGAAAKKAPDVRLAGVVDYATPITGPGLHFMDSPGNDLESVAGQVASGSNLIFFVTGNGSITNFPFVPTLKFVTTTRRYELLPQEMDINAGRYLDGEAMEKLTAEVLQQTLRVASGEQTNGEIAGHSQISIWRDWAIGEGLDSRSSLSREDLPDAAHKSIAALPAMNREIAHRDCRHGLLPVPEWPPVRAHVNLIAPTSLCSGQVANLIAASIEQRGISAGKPQRVVVSLPHTEGCGSGGSDDLYTRTLVGHVTHPKVAAALLLEHGCERTHNDYFRSALIREGQTADQFGWASIQLDGGIAAVTRRVTDYFAQATGVGTSPEEMPRSDGTPVIGILAAGPRARDPVADLLAIFAVSVVASGASIIAPSIGSTNEALSSTGIIGNEAQPSVRFAEAPRKSGLHLMESPTTHVDETVGAMAAAGAELIVAFSPQRPIHAHPFVPVLQFTDSTEEAGFDLVISNTSSSVTASRHLSDLVVATLAQSYSPKQLRTGQVAFQLTRGKSGVSL